ncbi:hypothetical protein K474DRAFT_1655632 [Panus rudis PR-1116 ss-1]|nr:hypothetical protein K474DRAFT_1655632 [Panus rudis PR-1116 ss-1]
MSNNMNPPPGNPSLSTQQHQALLAAMLNQNSFIAAQNPLMMQFAGQNPFAQMAATSMNSAAPGNSSNTGPHAPNPFNMGASSIPAFHQLLFQQQGVAQMQNPQVNVAQTTFSQLFADAIKLNTPVGTVQNDVELLVRALLESEQKGLSYRQALEGLHGVNNHAANLWKDYYLEYTKQIDELVREQRGIAASASSSSKSLRSGKANPQASGSSTHDPKHPRIKAEKNIGPKTVESAPSSSTAKKSCPTPPTKGCPKDPDGFRHDYTQEENEYMLKYADWAFDRNPKLTQQSLAKGLAKKVPFHSVASWRYHISRNMSLVEPLRAKARKARRCKENEMEDSDEAGGSDEDDHITESESKFGSDYEDGKSGSPDEDESSASIVRRGRRRPDSQDYDDSSDETDEEVDRQAMGGFGRAVTDADKRVIARYIASIDDWDILTMREKWDPFEQMFPQRNSKAWGETYRRYAEVIDLLVEKYRRRKLASEESISAQVGRPSWASRPQSSADDSRSGKRRYTGSDRHLERKRTKTTALGR